MFLIWPSQPHRQDVQHAAMHTDLSVVALQRAVLRPAAVLIHGTSPALVVHGALGTSAANFMYVVRAAGVSATCLRPRRLSLERAANFMYVGGVDLRGVSSHWQRFRTRPKGRAPTRRTVGARQTHRARLLVRDLGPQSAVASRCAVAEALVR